MMRTTIHLIQTTTAMCQTLQIIIRKHMQSTSPSPLLSQIARGRRFDHKCKACGTDLSTEASLDCSALELFMRTGCPIKIYVLGVS
mmetsp:Transcript_14544/g.21512  ORF Transcript_14544/g.21512 Transcript_14544/m.21512 type:complete len:86 (+) Transcript_14544:284-541(+)